MNENHQVFCPTFSPIHYPEDHKKSHTHTHVSMEKEKTQILARLNFSPRAPTCLDVSEELVANLELVSWALTLSSCLHHSVVHPLWY